MQEKIVKSALWSLRDIAVICVVVVLFLAAIAWVGAMRAMGGDMLQQHPLSLSALISSALLFVGVVTFVWWRNIDEAAREAHKWSWYWGGSAGLCGVLILFILIYMTGGRFGREIITGWNLTGRELELGMSIGVLLPTFSYTVAWGVWWARHH
jgi:hypothetical protein